jgi:hypothetical protein
MADKEFRSWQCPPAAVAEVERLGWINEGCEEGMAWHRMQRGSSDYPKAFDIFSGRTDSRDILTYRSQLTTARLKRNVREVIGACANIRPIWGYSSDNPDFAEQGNMMNKATRAIYLERFLDLSIKEGLQWSALTATGWIRPVYRRGMYGTGKGNLTFLTYGSPSVLPVQLPSNNDWQEAYAVTIMDELPIAMAHGMFPEFQDRLRPTSSKYWYSPEIRKAAKGNLFQRIWNKWGRGTGSMMSDLYAPVRYTYVIDLTINKTGDMIPMGQPGTSWYYEVPSLGSELWDGRKANENDARLYPRRRLIISSENCIMYDGPAFDWHGEFPAIPFCLDAWAWEAIGFSIIRDGFAIQQGINELERGVMDKHRAQLDPALGYDINSVTRNEADVFDPMQPRARVGFDGSLVERPFVPIIPEQAAKVDPMTMEFINHLEGTMDHQLAIRDIVALAKARSGGGVTDIEKMMEAEGPIVQDISRNIERAITGVGNQCKYIILQFYTAKRVMRYVGAANMPLQSFDYDPDSLVPSHLPGEDPSKGDSHYNRSERARHFANNLSLTILPHSIHEITQMAHKLGLIQMRKAGVQVDSQSIAEAWNVHDFAAMKKRYWEEQEEIAQHALRLKKMAMAIEQAGVSPTPAIANAIATLEGQQTQEGRPPSGQEAPKLVEKEGGGRSTISESGS